MGHPAPGARLWKGIYSHSSQERDEWGTRRAASGCGKEFIPTHRKSAMNGAPGVWWCAPVLGRVGVEETGEDVGDGGGGSSDGDGLEGAAEPSGADEFALEGAEDGEG